MIKTIRIPIPGNPYKVYIGEGSLGHLSGYIKTNQTGSDACIITTPRILALHGAKLKNELQKICKSILILTVPDSEKSKNAKTAFELIEKIMAFDKKKQLFLIAFGGGVVGDLTGFIAAIYKRGVPYVQIPTTLLAQIDSSIGGKTAIDTTFGKNLVGAFYQPRFVVSDNLLLKTLPKTEILAGLSEMIKYALIKDAALFSFLRKNLKTILKNKKTSALQFAIERCITIKARIVGLDEFDKKGLRMILNFGHTLGHAIEAASDFKTSHGEAVAIGMVCASRLSEMSGLLKRETSQKILKLIHDANLPMKAKDIKREAILEALTYDKKFQGMTSRFVLLKKIGRTKIVNNIPRSSIEKVIKEISSF